MAGCGLDLTGAGGVGGDDSPSPDGGAGASSSSAGPDATKIGDEGGAIGSGDAAAPAPAPRDAATADVSSDAPIDSPPPLYPGSCAELPNSGTGLDVTLYWDKDPTKPYDAHCGANGAVYVRLNDTTGKNSTTYPLGTASCTRLVTGQTKVVVTTWTMLRFDPVTHLVDTGDYAGATSTGGTHEDSGNNTVHIDFTKMPFASGRVCDSGLGAAPVATIDLSKTKLAVAAGQAWSHDGYQGASSFTADAKNQKITLKIAGYSAGVSACAANADYYTENGGKCLLLVYSP